MAPRLVATYARHDPQVRRQARHSLEPAACRSADSLHRDGSTPSDRTRRILSQPPSTAGVRAQPSQCGHELPAGAADIACHRPGILAMRRVGSSRTRSSRKRWATRSRCRRREKSSVGAEVRLQLEKFYIFKEPRRCRRSENRSTACTTTRRDTIPDRRLTSDGGKTVRMRIGGDGDPN